MVDAAHDAYGRLDILVNNAGCNIRKPALEVTWDDWNTILDTNLRGTFFVAQAVARHMVPHGYGRIINIGSVTSVYGYAGLAPYGASRGGVKQMTMSLADDWGPHGVTVNCLAPGWFEPRIRCLRRRSRSSYLTDRIPLKRPAARRSRRRRRVPRVRRQRIHHRPDAAGRRRHHDRGGQAWFPRSRNASSHRASFIPFIFSRRSWRKSNAAWRTKVVDCVAVGRSPETRNSGLGRLGVRQKSTAFCPPMGDFVRRRAGRVHD